MNAQQRAHVQSGLLTVQDVADRIQCSRQFVYKLIGTNCLTHIVLGTRVYVTEKALDDLLAARLRIGKIA